MENNKTDKFTFYQPYWDLVKDEDGATVKSIIGHICRYYNIGLEEEEERDWLKRAEKIVTEKKTFHT